MTTSVIFVLISYLVLLLVLVFHMLFIFSVFLVLSIFSQPKNIKSANWLDV